MDEGLFCDLCEEDFISINDLTSHVRRVHSVQTLFRCDACTSAFCLEENLEIHRRNHADPDISDPIQCKNCTESFACIEDLSAHNRSVHGRRAMIVCMYCKKVFRKDNLERHISTVHLGERTFQCSMCELSFSQKHSLQTHELVIHLKERPFMCSHCGKSFSRKDQLSHHTRAIHLQERPHVCALCDKAYTLRATLMKHTRTVHAKRDFDCDQCGRGFKHQKALDKHRCPERKQAPS